MSKIPYYFETPIPKYFRENGWFKCEHMFKFIHWAFSRCQTVAHKTVMEGRELLIQPFEFIAGRISSSSECFLTENIFRNQRLKLEKAGLLKKTTNSLTNHYSCYIWSTEVFSQTNNQPNNQPLTNHQPTINHKERTRTKKEEQQQTTPLPLKVVESPNCPNSVVVVSSKENQQNTDKIIDLKIASQFMFKDLEEENYFNLNNSQETVNKEFEKSEKEHNIHYRMEIKTNLNKKEGNSYNISTKSNNIKTIPCRFIPSFLNSLIVKGLNISEQEKIDLVNQFSDEQIENAIKCTIGKKINNPIGFLIDACKNNYKPPKTKEEIQKNNEKTIQLNREFSKKYDELYSRRKTMRIDVLSQGIDFTPIGANANVTSLKYSENDFQNTFLELMKKYDFDVSKNIDVDISNLIHEAIN